MKQIPHNQPGAQWNNELLKDLSFIKQRLRYPLSRKTLPALLVAVILLSCLFRLAMVFTMAESHVSFVLKAVMVPLLILVVVNSFYRYYRSLKFIAIPTPFFANENRKQVEAFLLSQQLAVYHHPEAPDVLQIISRPLGNAPNGQREVMIFIADDKRVLVNSHFVNQKFSVSSSSSNARKMANALRRWLQANYPEAYAGIYPNIDSADNAKKLR